MDEIYLDYAATSRKHFDIIEKCIDGIKNIYANPSSSHNIGKKSAKILKDSREKIANSINTNSKNIIFTSGGTESNNMVFNYIGNKFTSGDIIISNIEHPSVRLSAENLSKKGFNVIKLPVSNEGYVDLEMLEKMITKNTVLISIMFANNETGIIQPIKKITAIAKRNNILVHSDIVQAYCKVSIDVEELNVDFASVSAHKIGGTNGIGFLYSRVDDMVPLLLGGGQENGLRAGTSDVIGVNILAECIAPTVSSMEKIKYLKNYFIKKLSELQINYEVNGNLKYSLPNILNLYFTNLEAQRLITYLDSNSIYISGGSACSSGNLKGSKIIKDMYNLNRANHSVRISFGFDNTEKQLDFVARKIKELEDRIKERNN